jgi:hypothetical protein
MFEYQLLPSAIESDLIEHSWLRTWAGGADTRTFQIPEDPPMTDRNRGRIFKIKIEGSP